VTKHSSPPPVGREPSNAVEADAVPTGRRSIWPARQPTVSLGGGPWSGSWSPGTRPGAAAVLAEDLPTLCVHLGYPLRLRNRHRSTNLLERSRGEVKRQIDDVGERETKLAIYAGSRGATRQPARPSCS
jgi:hypothetical protein